MTGTTTDATRVRAASPEGVPDGPEGAPRARSDEHTDAPATPLGRSGGVKVCDDCGQEYPGPAYYTFPPYSCRTSNHDGDPIPHRGCTENLCPRCAGPYLEPDRRGDPRRPTQSAWKDAR